MAVLETKDSGSGRTLILRRGDKSPVGIRCSSVDEALAIAGDLGLGPVVDPKGKPVQSPDPKGKTGKGEKPEDTDPKGKG